MAGDEDEMVLVEGTITAISPLHLGTGRKTGTFVPTLRYIPGRTLRGMLGYWLYKNDRELFNKSGINEDSDHGKMGIFVKNAYPLEQKLLPVYAPSTLMWCKRCGTLLPEGAHECPASENNVPCLHEGKRYQGLIISTSLKDRKLHSVASVKTRTETKCPITRNAHTSPGSKEEGYDLSPYHVESLLSGTQFGFRILFRQSLADPCIDALKQAGIFAGIGGLRSRGYGSIRINNEIKRTPVGEWIENRAKEIKEMNRLLLVLNAPAIVLKEREAHLGFAETFFETVRTSLSTHGFNGSITRVAGGPQKVNRDIARGWSLKHGNTLAPLIPCTGPGSCIEVHADPEACASLEAYGCGYMTNCGYGDLYFTEVPQ